MVEDEIGHLGCELIKAVATKTNHVAGDGTTTSVILTQALITEGLKKTELGFSSVGIRLGMEKALKKSVEWLRSNATPINTEADLINVATISANSKEIGEKVAEAVQAVGKEGNVSLTDGSVPGIKVNKISGMQIDRGYLSPYMFRTSEEYSKQEIVIENCPIVVSDQELTSPDLQKINAACIAKYPNTNQCLVVCESTTEDALSNILYNILEQKGYRMVVIKAPAFGEGRDEECEDISTYAKATYLSSKKNLTLNSIQDIHVGFVEKAIIKDFKTILVNASENKPLEERIQMLKERVQNTDGEFNKSVLNDRITKMQGMVSEIEVAGISETETKDLKLRVEDSLNATKVAALHGIVAGGGTTLARLSKELDNYINTNVLTDDEIQGIKIVSKALLYPIKQLAENSGLSGEVIVDKVLSSDDIKYGFNAKNDTYGDLLDMGVIDPVFVTITALENAVSASMMFLVTGCAMETKINSKLKMGNE